MIDLRSDTVTLPTPAMRAAMAAAAVGDDVYQEDPTVEELEARTAEILGKEDALYLPSGTMSNQVALKALTSPGDMAIMDGASHMVINEGGAAAALSGVTVWRVQGSFGVFGGDDVLAAIGVEHAFQPPHHSPLPRVVCIENTHNAGGGSVWPMDAIRSVAEAAHANGLSLHMDGARIWHAAIALGIPEAKIAEPFDSVSVCFSKGLGAPVGSALVGTRGFVERARRYKKMFGGGMRQAGIVAAGALYALDHHRVRLAEDHRNARRFAEAVSCMEGAKVSLERVQTNIVRFEVTAMSANGFVDACYARGVHMLPGGHHGVRAVPHLGIDAGEVDQALSIIKDVLGGARA